MYRPVLRGFQTSSHPEERQLASDRRDVAERVEEYLSKRGIFTEEKAGSQSIAVVGRESELIPGGGGRQKLRPWTDAKGNEITDFAVYWTYADREAGEKLPWGLWRIRLAHYQPRGEIRLTSVQGGCDVDFHLRGAT